MPRSMLAARGHRINNDRGIVQSVIHREVHDNPTEEVSEATEPESVESETNTTEEVGTESIGDPVDWNQTPESLGDSTTWDDEIELLD